jgi:RimJ/RimL family protein N-acetyltransferase
MTATRYELRVAGHLDDRWADWFGDVTITRHDDGTTSLAVPVADQAQLHGLLAGVRDLGASLVSLRTEDPQPATLRHPLHTERLTLRPAAEADVEPTWTYRRLEQVGEWLSGTPVDLDGYRSTFLEPARLASTVVVELNGSAARVVVGDLMLRLEDAWAQTEVRDRAKGTQVELGWVLDPRHTGHGYATEAVRELLRYSFDDLGVRRVVAGCFAANEASWRLMERVGMRRETYAVRDALHRSGAWLDSLVYAILADEWATDSSSGAPVSRETGHSPVPGCPGSRET